MAPQFPFAVLDQSDLRHCKAAIFTLYFYYAAGWFNPLDGCDHQSAEGVPLPELLFLQGMYAWSIFNKYCAIIHLSVDYKAAAMP